jgi:hypothetical protein
MDDGDPLIHVVTVTAITEVATVHLYESTLLHVEVEHPEVRPLLPSIVAAVTTAISNPTRVEHSRPTSYVFVDETTTNAEGYPLRVAVRPVPGTNSGRVTTFYFASTEDVPSVIYRRASG